MDDLILIGCGQSKKSGSHPAAKLYTGHVFRMSRLAAEASGFPWAILSGKHHLVWPTDLISSYDCQLNKLSAAQRADWGRACVESLNSRFPLSSRVRVTILATRFYSDSVADLLRDYDCEVLTPLAALDMFSRVSRLKKLRDDWIKQGIKAAIAS